MYQLLDFIISFFDTLYDTPFLYLSDYYYIIDIIVES